MKKTLIFILFSIIAGVAYTQPAVQAIDIIRKADERARGKTSEAVIKMTVIRPTWQREMTMKSWSLGNDFALILVTGPVRDKGVAFLKREHEMWNWQPNIDRTIKLPPSMMLQSWMGSDFTNDDLVRESSIVQDYTHRITGSESIDGRDCYVIELTPKTDAAVVWGKVITWIDKKDYIQMKVTFYDEDGELAQTMYGKDIKNLGGKMLPSTMEVHPADKPGQRTVITYESLVFDKPIQPSFFSLQNLKQVRP